MSRVAARLSFRVVGEYMCALPGSLPKLRRLLLETSHASRNVSMVEGGADSSVGQRSRQG